MCKKKREERERVKEAKEAKIEEKVWKLIKEKRKG